MEEEKIVRVPIITVKPADIYISINDTVTDDIQRLTDTEWDSMLNQKVRLEVAESGQKRGEKEEATAYVWIQKIIDSSINHEFLNKKITPFDMKVLEACISAQQQGAKYTTVNSIFKTFGAEREPFHVMKEKIMDSIHKLRHLDIRIDATDAYKKLNRLKGKQQPNAKGKIVFQGYILPAETLTANIQGQVVEGVICFLKASPILQYAIDKGHTYKIPRNLLVAPIKNTEAFIVLKVYILTRIKAIKRARAKNKKFPANIRLDTLFEKSGYSEVIKKDHKTKKRILENIIEYLKHLILETQEITGFTLLKEIKDKKTGKVTDVECKHIKDADKIKILYREN